jgi:hypothetical protein
MRGMLSVDEPELDFVIDELKVHLKEGCQCIPLFIYTTLENYGVEISKLIQKLEQEIYVESEIHDSYWGC